MMCFTATKTEAVPPKTPYGGGFAYETYTLNYLYEEYRFHNNIWTASNILKDLCRFLFVKFTFYRHSKVDFIIAYSRDPPFTLTKWTYPGIHPHQLLLEKHHRVLLSERSNPKGKLTLKLKIKPPRQMISKWFFSSQFSKYPLVAIKATAADFRNSYLGCCNENPQVGFFYLNHSFFQNSNWAAQSTTYYKPYDKAPPKIQFKDAKGQPFELNFDTTTPYADSVSFDKGWFQPKVLTGKTDIRGQTGAVTPTNVAFYNPNIDKGDHNEIYLISILQSKWDPPKTDLSLYLGGLPLWLGLFGFLSWVEQHKNTPNFLDTYVLIIRSPAIFPYSQIGAGNFYLPLSRSFINGKGPYNQPPTTHEKQFWYPSIKHQLEILNIFVQCGPYIPKLNDQKESTWELKCKYCFYFKWGGPPNTDKEITNPANQDKYDVPDTVTKRIQITNPETQTTESIIHPWDYRRGFIKESAIKRMCENFSLASDVQSNPEEPQKKKIRLGPQPEIPGQKDPEIQKCLQALYKENIFQEPQTQEETHQLIIQQQLQQQELKRNLLMLLTELKTQQQQLQLHTGLLS